jgi:hypothetical protein
MIGKSLLLPNACVSRQGCMERELKPRSERRTVPVFHCLSIIFPPKALLRKGAATAIRWRLGSFLPGNSDLPVALMGARNGLRHERMAGGQSRIMWSNNDYTDLIFAQGGLSRGGLVDCIRNGSVGCRPFTSPDNHVAFRLERSGLDV